MALSAGHRLGPYEILAPLGAGGMGEVYRARDTRLERTVAIKILPPQFAADSQFRERFDREAKTISQLNHPHICTLHDVGEHNGTAFLVMECVEGETLATRIERGPLKLDEALKIAIEIAGALDAAHRAGVVHRDLKPGNVMVTKAGAKLLDFGLAKNTFSAVGAGLQTGPGLTASPTMTSPLTAQGTILGTFQYMAPEQLEGQEADARTDIWGFGCVLYEMVTGRKAFQGKTQVSLIGAILKDEPPLVSTVQAMSPAVLDFVVRKCLAKDPDNRWQTARDLASQLEWIAQGGSQVLPTAIGARAALRARRERVAWMAVALVSVLLAALLAVRLYLARPVEERVVHFNIATPDMPSPYQVTISPDGRLVAFVATGPGNEGSVIWVRPLDSTVAQPLAGTERAIQLFWSPDSRQIGFGADQKLKRIDVSGGAPQTICEVPGLFAGGTWNKEDVIVFSTGVSLNRVAATGGASVSVAELDQARRETNLRWPFFLPDGRHFLYSAQTFDLENRGAIYAGSLDSPERTRLLNEDSMAAYVRQGYLLFQREGILMAQPFDFARLRVSGDPVRVVDDIASSAPNGRAAFAVADSGVLTYTIGSAQTSEIRWFDRSGKPLDSVGEPGPFGVLGQIALSPDEKKVAVTRPDPKTGSYDVWILELSSNILTRLTLDTANDNDVVWAPDGRSIAFTSNRKGKNDFYQRTLGGSNDTVIFESPENPKYVDDWSRDGRFLLYRGDNERTILALPMMGERKPNPLIQTPFTKDESHFSPDGGWVAYNSNESGTTEVFVASFPAFENRKQVSLRGGGEARWRSDGKELFYMSSDGKLMSVAVTLGPTPEFGVPRILFQTPIRTPNLGIDRYAVTGDGQRFLVLSPRADSASAPITVMVNWTNLLKR